MLRLVIEGIALSPIEVPTRATHVEVQWRSGAVTKLDVPRPDRRTRRRTPPDAVEQIRAMVKEEDLSDVKIAERLNAAGMKTGASKPWNGWAVRWSLPRRCDPSQRPRQASSPPGDGAPMAE
jgi:hypothetical protein